MYGNIGSVASQQFSSYIKVWCTICVQGYNVSMVTDDLKNKARVEEEERKRRIRENYEKAVKHKGKTFNWATKTYK